MSGRVHLIDAERQTLAKLGKKIGKQALAQIATFVNLDTILAWNRKLAAQKFDGSDARKSRGCPRVDKEIEEWVVKMAKQNRSWSYDRIVGALSELGYQISDQTVGNVLKRHVIPPALGREKNHGVARIYPRLTLLCYGPPNDLVAMR